MMIQLPTSENSAILLHPSDNVAIARVQIGAGMTVRDVRTHSAIPAGHKIAMTAIAAGENIRRYGQVIGRAKVAIDAGSYVHTHNVSFEELIFDYEFPKGSIAIPTAPADAPTFMGYAREDGRAGTRNYIAVVAASNCAAHTVERIAASFEDQPMPENVDGVVAFPHGDGCGQSPGPDLAQLRRTLGGVLDHPN